MLVYKLLGLTRIIKILNRLNSTLILNRCLFNLKIQIMKSLKMNLKKSAMLFGIAGMFAGAVACNAPQSNEGETTDPATEDEMYEEPMPSDDTTSAVDTTLTDTLDGGF